MARVIHLQAMADCVMQHIPVLFDTSKSIQLLVGHNCVFGNPNNHLTTGAQGFFVKPG